MNNIEKIRNKALELDELINSFLESEPEDQIGEYGIKIREVFSDCRWLDVFVGEFDHK